MRVSAHSHSGRRMIWRSAPRLRTQTSSCFIAGLFLVGALACVAPEFAHAQGVDPYTAGIEAFERGDASEALQLFQRAAALRPQDARVANALGNAWQALRRPAKARQEYLRALALDPRLFAAKKNLGILEFQERDFPSAERNLTLVVRALPLDPVAWRFLGLSLESERRPKDAIAPLQRSLAIQDDNPQVRLDLARVEASSDDHLAALADYRRLLRESRIDFESQKSVGFALASLGDSASATSQYQFILESHPGAEQVSLALAQAYLQDHNPDQALSVLQAGVSGATDKASFYALTGTIYQQGGKSDAAAKSYRQAILADPRRPDPYLQLSWLYMEFRHFDDAATTLREGLRFVSDPLGLKLQLGTILVMGGHEQDAVPVLKDVIAAQPHSPTGYTTLIIAYTLIDPTYSRALEVAERSMKMCSPNYLTYYLHAGLLFRIHRQDFAQSTPASVVRQIKSELGESIRLNPDFPHSSYDLARVEFETQNYTAAEQEAEAALRADKEFTEARYLLGKIYLKEGRREEGLAAMAQVEQQHMDDIRQVESMGQVLLAQQAAAMGSGSILQTSAGGESASK